MEQAIQIIEPTLYIVWDVLKNWWWLPLPFILWRPFKFFWLWWRMEDWMFKQKKILLEVKMPKEVLKPIRSMEQVFSSLWAQNYDPPDWWEKWWEGKQNDSMQLEMVSLQGQPHLFIRCSEGRRNAIESSIYSQYPDAEIDLVDDYTKYVPQDAPNKDWELWGADFEMIKPDVYPIKTYTKFFEEKEAAKEEKRVDPMATLLEGMGKIGPGEQIWIQISVEPVTSSSKEAAGDFIKRGREIADKLAKRPEKGKQRAILREAAEELAYGTMPGQGEKKEEPIIPPEMKLTPGEREIVEGVESKVGKRCFHSYIRFIYIAKRESYFGGVKGIPFGFFGQFSTENLNALKPWPRTMTKIKRYPVLDLLRARRTFRKKRRLFFRYIKRFTPLFPKPTPVVPGSGKGSFILNTEELATIFHFPGRVVAPAPFVSRVESKRGEAPPGLPVE
ncbi:MAG: hypothetical protein PHF07_01375 [Candidatus Pacebacteria bacterium]|jgi:hypothetical protein|nr:hypothetical protein [Candidatus Paceibacterota bacterium]